MQTFIEIDLSRAGIADRGMQYLAKVLQNNLFNYKTVIKQLQEKLLGIKDLPLTDQKSILENEFEKWRGNLEQVDDVLIIGLKI